MKRNRKQPPFHDVCELPDGVFAYSGWLPWVPVDDVDATTDRHSFSYPAGAVVQCTVPECGRWFVSERSQFWSFPGVPMFAVFAVSPRRAARQMRRNARKDARYERKAARS